MLLCDWQENYKLKRTFRYKKIMYWCHHRTPPEQLLVVCIHGHTANQIPTLATTALLHQCNQNKRAIFIYSGKGNVHMYINHHTPLTYHWHGHSEKKNLNKQKKNPSHPHLSDKPQGDHQLGIMLSLYWMITRHLNVYFNTTQLVINLIKGLLRLRGPVYISVREGCGGVPQGRCGLLQ